MKNKKYLFILFIVFGFSFIGINNVYADSLGFECNKTTLEVGESTTCKVVGTIDHPSRGVIARLGSNSNIEIGAKTNISPFDQGNVPIYYYTDATHTVAAGSYDILRFEVTALAEGSGNLTLRDFGGDDGMGFIDATGDQFYYLDPVDFTITVTDGGTPSEKSHDSSLAGLVPNVGELNPEFRSDFTAYTMSVDFTRVRGVTFTVTKNHPMQTIGNTTFELPNSTSVEYIDCVILVTAEDGTTKTPYSVQINNSAYNPGPAPTEDIFINRLTYDVDAVLTPTFKKDTYKYDMSVNFANVHEINFTAQVDEGVTVSGKKCILPSSLSVQSTTCNIRIEKGDKSAVYKITVHNTYDPDIQCDLVIRSNVYTIDQTNKIIKVNSEHSKETIKANLYSSCGEIQLYDDKVVISDTHGRVEYKLERIIMPQTGNVKIVYPLAIISVLGIIAIFVFAKKKLFVKEK